MNAMGATHHLLSGFKTYLPYRTELLSRTVSPAMNPMYGYHSPKGRTYYYYFPKQTQVRTAFYRFIFVLID